MFTGIVEAVGRVVARVEGDGEVTFRVRCPEIADDLEEGESVALDGVCQTVTVSEGGDFTVRAVATTLERTTADRWGEGRRLNLERALALGDRLGGHLVQGHVDATGTVRRIRRDGETVRVTVALPGEVARVTVPRGSLTMDGVSLTVAGLDGRLAEVALIPYTWSHTNLDRLDEGTRVNLEADLMGKYAARYLAPYRDAGPGPEEG